MTDSNVRELENQVVAARLRLAGNLSALRSPRTYSEFSSSLKSDALDVKDALLDRAKVSAQGSLANLVEDLKGRAAANPAAALAIGAGIAWRLIQRPPIASALIGAGLLSLLRTERANVPRGNDGAYLAKAKERLAEQASELAESVKERASEAGDALATKATEVASAVQSQASGLTDAISETVQGVADAAHDKAQDWSDEVRDSIRKIRGPVGRRVEVDERKMSLADGRGRDPSAAAGASPDARDNMLLGAAGVAIVAALGIAWQRRSNEPTWENPQR
jgi:hypothetical protein